MTSGFLKSSFFANPHTPDLKLMFHASISGSATHRDIQLRHKAQKPSACSYISTSPKLESFDADESVAIHFKISKNLNGAAQKN